MWTRKSLSLCKNLTFLQSRALHTNGFLLGKKEAKAAGKKDKFLDAERDPEKLCKFVCGANIMKNGQDPEIKPDSEYPDWLWNLKLERGPYEREPDTFKYWRLVRRKTLQQMNKERKKVA